MAVYLGIDVGGSKTECALGDRAHVLASVQGKTAKLARVNEAEARDAVHGVVRRVCDIAGVQPGDVDHVCIGAAGAARPEVVSAFRRMLGELVRGEIDVVGDMQIAHQAAFDGGPGIVVIAGTGSVAYGVNPRGESARAGGWGGPISDEGSGEWIGRTAVGDVLLAHDAGAHSGLLHRVSEAWGISSPAEVAKMANASPAPNFAALFPHVMAAAEGGDLLARDVLVRAAHELGQLAMIVVRRLWPAPTPFAVAMSGGVFANAPLVREVFTHVLNTYRPDATISLGTRPPAEGALMMARAASVGRSAG